MDDPHDHAPDREWLVWQLADSAFPAGALAHSAGLEAAWQHGWVDGPSLPDLLRCALAQAARGMVPFLAAACREPAGFAAIDDACDVLLSNHVANRASRAQGRALLSVAARVFAAPALVALHDRARREKLPCHLAPAFGVMSATLRLPLHRAATLYLFLVLRGLSSAAVRLGIVGPLEAQSVQASVSPRLASLACAALEVRPEDAAQTTPLLDLLQGAQDRLYSRLFQS